MSEAKTIKEKFSELPSSAKTAIIGGGGIVALMLGLGILDSNEAKNPNAGKAPLQESVVGNPSSSSNADISADLERTRQKNDEQNREIAQLKELIQKQQEAGGSGESRWSEVSSLTAQMQALTEKMNAMQAGKAGGPNLDSSLPPVPGMGVETPRSRDIVGQPPAQTQIQVIGADLAKEKRDAKKKAAEIAKEADDVGAYIPLGSNFEGVLLNGMDAGTGVNANRTPAPALIRVKSSAILPNAFKFDVKECFVMIGGYGNLSSERVEMRTEAMSCIAQDGQVFESKIEGYVVGEDGKTGARGRLVSKQGAILAKSFVAGMASGLGKAFTPPTQVLSNTATSAYVLPDAKTTLGTAVGGGIGAAGAALSEFYIKMADQMFPVLEVDAGRKMTVILHKGVELRAEKKS
jgi:conjugal transfer pilus assembly protein TraB